MNNFITTLFHFIINPDIHDSNYLIAYGLIRYGNQIQDISIHELSEKCLVSVSAINRFINLFGFKRYQIFKSTFYNHIKVRESQMLYRYSKKEESQLKVVLSSFLKDDLIDHQSQGEKYDLDNSKIFYNFSESTGKDFEIYLETFSII